MINTVTTKSDVESALLQSDAVLIRESTTDIDERIRMNFLQTSASYLGAKKSRSQIKSMINSHMATHPN